MIYHLIGDLRAELGDRMPPVEVEDIVGRLVVLFLGKINSSGAQGHSDTTVPSHREEGEGCCSWMSGEGGVEPGCVNLEIFSGGCGKVTQRWHL